ncbi:DUF4113 domain-containing protein [Pseudomonas sp.]|uniref:DUF4113 domain-containing protein n=1 Tax=Pseudomonas sp. TaxID=306 RepID=UPI002CB165C8|nr:DUF4113 domain-containing protein [Pseudomonas sp.]HUE90519.1 DUF4113 domain-containing protein [Pseudomonas sp.]
MAVIKQVNRKEGRGTLRIGSVPTPQAGAMRREMRSQRFTTRGEEVIGAWIEELFASGPGQGVGMGRLSADTVEKVAAPHAFGRIALPAGAERSA